jgi:N-acetylneuraminic acid mutarotase
VKTTLFVLTVVLLVSIWLSGAAAQDATVTHNTWTSGASMPVSLGFSMAGTLTGHIFVVGGATSIYGNGSVVDTQVYNPTTNTWSTGVPLPTALCCGSTAVVNNILYVIGGYDGTSYYDTVWAYNPKTKTWTSKSPMPTARGSTGVAVENGIIYVIGGNSAGMLRLNTVESYNPATDTWTEEAPLTVGKSEPSVTLTGSELKGYTIVAADGHVQSDDTGDNEGYNASANTWTTLHSDPTARNGACAAGIGAKMYVAGGYDGGVGGDMTLNESFNVFTDSWKTMAPLPQATLLPAAAVYKGKLYCFGGVSAYNGGPVDYVQIYQP